MAQQLCRPRKLGFLSPWQRPALKLTGRRVSETCKITQALWNLQWQGPAILFWLFLYSLLSISASSLSKQPDRLPFSWLCLLLHYPLLLPLFCLGTIILAPQLLKTGKRRILENLHWGKQHKGVSLRDSASELAQQPAYIGRGRVFTPVSEKLMSMKDCLHQSQHCPCNTSRGSHCQAIRETVLPENGCRVI